MIRLATMRDIDAVETMYRELLTHEARYGSNSNWVLDLYPTRETAVNGCLEQTLYVLLDEGVFCASMILNQLQPVEYKKIKWAYPAAPEDILVIHTLCVPPQQAGKGYGKQMVRYAIQKAMESDCDVIRLDTWEGNRPAAELYQNLGFQYAGSADILLQGLIEEKQIFFEMKLGKTSHHSGVKRPIRLPSRALSIVMMSVTIMREEGRRERGLPGVG